MSRNPWMIDQPDAIKAAIMASGTFNAGTNKDIIGGGNTSTQISSREGAGVLDAGFCFQVAQNGRWVEHVFTEYGNWTNSIYADCTSRPFRVAIAWQVKYNNTNPNIIGGDTQSVQYQKYGNCADTRVDPEVDIRLFKNGHSVGFSSAYSNHITNMVVPELNYQGLCTNYEIIEISPSILNQYGVGYYELRIINRTQGAVTVSAAWEQY